MKSKHCQMSPYIILLLAIIFEVTGTLLLPASKNFSKALPTIFLLICYIFSFYCLSVITNKLPLAIIYSSWAGLGIFSIALLSSYFYKQTLNLQVIIGLLFIVIGVLIVNIYKDPL